MKSSKKNLSRAVFLLFPLAVFADAQTETVQSPQVEAATVAVQTVAELEANAEAIALATVPEDTAYRSRIQQQADLLTQIRQESNPDLRKEKIVQLMALKETSGDGKVSAAEEIPAASELAVAETERNISTPETAFQLRLRDASPEERTALLTAYANAKAQQTAVQQESVSSSVKTLLNTKRAEKNLPPIETRVEASQTQATQTKE